MHIWTIEKWKKFVPREHIVSANRIGLFPDKNTDPEVVAACRDFIAWVKGEYFFPHRLRIYLKNQRTIPTMDGDHAVGIFFEPDNDSQIPTIKVAVGDYAELLESIGRDNALCTLLTVIAHEMTHYFQWINGLMLTDRGRERQANQYAHFILSEYSGTREHP